MSLSKPSIRSRLVSKAKSYLRSHSLISTRDMSQVENALLPHHSDEAKYSYTRLHEGQIRLLGVDSTNNTIMYKLVQISLEKAPPYRALSYAWGDQEPTASIVCNGECLSITPHLYEALISLRRLPEPHLFWIDAICIDQHNGEEKSLQVPLMGDIYTSAYQVVVWLGKTDNGSDSAIQIIPVLLPLLESFEESNQLHILGFDTEFRHDGDFDLSNGSFGLLNHAMWNAIFGLFHRSWFKRLWVVQEVILAKNITILCGSDQLEWMHLCRFLYLFRKTRLCREATLIDSQPTVLDFLGMEIHRLTFQLGSLIDPVHFIATSRRRQVKKPIDAVYGVLGVLSCQLRRQITVDYSLTSQMNFWNTYAQLGRELIKLPSLQLLYQAPSKNKPPELPSWCPDFSSSSFAFKAGRQTGRAGTLAFYNVPPVGVSPTTSNITIFGLEMDTVKQVVALKPREMEKVEGNADEAAATMESLFECASLAREVYKQSDDHYLDFLYAMVAGSYNDRRIMEEVPYPSELLQADYRNLLDYLFMWRYSIRVPGIDYNFDKATSGLRFFDACERLETSFIVTESGLVGLGQDGVKVGDSICIFFTAETPFLLRRRPHKETYEFVGAAYVRRFMDGTEFNKRDPATTHQAFEVE